MISIKSIKVNDIINMQVKVIRIDEENDKALIEYIQNDTKDKYEYVKLEKVSLKALEATGVNLGGIKL